MSANSQTIPSLFLYTSALIVLSHYDREIRALIIGCPLYSNSNKPRTGIEEKLKIQDIRII